MCRRECLSGYRCEDRAACRAAEARAEAQRETVQAIARARKAHERQEAGLGWSRSARLTRA